MGKSKKNRQQRKRISKANAIDYDYHLPVLLKESCDLLISSENGIYIDGTMGGGGHSTEILRRLKGGKLLAFDKDEEAIQHCRLRLAEELKNESLTILNECFSKACSREELRGVVQGFLLDLGVSSRQLDESCRGFSYRADSSLNMNFDASGNSAEEIINAATEEELERILRNFGEEPFASRIARRIVEMRRVNSINSTFDLRNIVIESVPNKLIYKSLSRVFQAFRIAVNNELDTLDYTLSNIMPIIASAGRIVIISYHSLEDRIVKNHFKALTKSKNINKYAKMQIDDLPKFKLITPKPFVPSAQEIELNPRARSAKLRAIEKI